MAPDAFFVFCSFLINKGFVCGCVMCELPTFAFFFVTRDANETSLIAFKMGVWIVLCIVPYSK